MAKAITSTLHEVDSQLDAIEFCYEKGWTDGLPVVPPTEKKVLEFLDYAQLEPGQVLGEIPERNRVVTAEKLAINAVMAGCLKEYMPVLVAVVEAVCDPAFKFNHLASFGSPWPIMIISGPVVEELGLNYGIWAMGPGFRPNATIGRTLSLVVSNVAAGYVGAIQRGTYGHPGRFNSMCVGENPEAADFGWEPHNVEMGFDKNTSTVTLLSTYPWMQQPMSTDMRPERILAVISDSIAEGDCYRGVYPILMGAPWAQVFAKAGWSKEDMKNWMYENTKRSIASLKARGRWGILSTAFEGYGATLHEIEPGDEDKYVYVWKEGPYDKYILDAGATERQKGIYFICAGGDGGQRCMWLAPYQFSTNPVTKPIRKPGAK